MSKTKVNIRQYEYIYSQNYQSALLKTTKRLCPIF